MSRLIALSILAALLFVAATANAQTEQKSSSHISIEMIDGVLQWQIENSRFDVVRYWRAGDETSRTLLVRQDETATMRSDREGPEKPLVGVATFDVNDDASLTPRWSLEAPGDTGGVRDLGPFGQVYVATLFGCCGALNADQYYGLDDGNHLLTTNGTPAALEVPNSRGLVRLAGVETPWTASAEPIFRDQRDTLGIVGYASLDDEIERVRIVFSGGAAESIDSLMSLPDIEWVPDNGDVPARELTLWGLDGERDASKIGGLSLRVTYTPDAWVEIPVVADRFDIDAASTAPGLSLEFLP
jgi:hypothetical protein